uniref:Uncharacterized protein n=1 Tax=Glossina austeni TaxID=7395 RepID=A0A1A9V8D9_GLOAU
MEQENNTDDRSHRRQDEAHQQVERATITQTHAISRADSECRETEQEHDTEGRYRRHENEWYRQMGRGRDAARTGPLFCSVEQNRNTEEHVDIGREHQDNHQYEQCADSTRRQSAKLNID